MAESREPYTPSEIDTLAALVRMLTAEQLHILIAELGVIVEHGYGELTIRVNGNSIYFLPARSIDGGKLVITNPNGG